MKLPQLSLALLSIVLLTYCSSPEAGSASATRPAAQPVQEEAPAAPAQPLNPNLATPDELAAHLPQALLEQVIDQRPFLSTGAFVSLLGEQMEAGALERLSTKVFVPLNLNTASKAEILAVPGVGEKMAHEFEEYRPYQSMAQFRREIGKYVDEQQVAAYARYVYVPVDLNTGTAEEILAIPGVGAKMLHEFEEYRPYQSMAQFRREIGKYVDEQELARLERYVQL